MFRVLGLVVRSGVRDTQRKGNRECRLAGDLGRRDTRKRLFVAWRVDSRVWFGLGLSREPRGCWERHEMCGLWTLASCGCGSSVRIRSGN